MGGEQAASVLAMVKKDNFETDEKDWSSKAVASFKKQIRDQYETQAHLYYATSRLWGDGIIDLVDTSSVIDITRHCLQKFLQQHHATVFLGCNICFSISALRLI